MGIAENLERLKERITKAALGVERNVDEVKLVAVTKGVGAERIIEAAQWGANIFGENYAQEFRDKYNVLKEALGREVEWHFIGHLQRNKIKYLIGRISLIESLDNVSVAEEINKRAERLEVKVPVLIQVNTGGEETKGGIKPSQLEDFLIEMERFPRIYVEGLMTMPPFFDDSEMARPYFRILRKLRDRLQNRFPGLKELSMGMSGDFETAIEEGATIVRVGTAIFGPRV
jgi:pyridoxal phosphate enzyme (YggS family)